MSVLDWVLNIKKWFTFEDETLKKGETAMKFIKSINKEMILITVWFVMIFKFFLSGNSEKLFTSQYFLYIFLGLPIILLLFRMCNAQGETGNWLKTQLENPKMLAAKVIGVVLFIAFFSWSIDSGNTENAMFFFNIIFFAILIVGVLLLFRTLKGVIYSIEGWLGILGRIVFFIPCAISDFFFYLMGQFKKSPFVGYVLIAIEIVIILLYKYPK